MPELSENQLVVLTGKPPRTVRKRLDKLEFKRGKGRAKLYDSAAALMLIYQVATPDDGGITAAEALRRLSIAKTEQINLANEITRRERIPLDDVSELLAEREAAMRRVIIAQHEKVMTRDAINELFEELRGTATDAEALGPKAEAA